MATEWLPYNSGSRKRWLLGNGETITMPLLEATRSKRKVRIAGTNTSAWMRDIDDFMLDAAKRVAKRRNSYVWMSLGGQGDLADLKKTVGFNPFETAARFHLVEPVAKTRMFWQFRHADMPVDAFLVMEMFANNTSQRITTRLVMQPTQPRTELTTDYRAETGPGFKHRVSALSPWQAERFGGFLAEEPPEWDASALLSSDTFPTHRQATIALLDKVKKANNLPAIQVPDMRDPTKPAWLTLDLHETNVTGKLVNDLTDYLESTPAIEKALGLYQQMQEQFRQLGFVLGAKTENDFQKALTGGVEKALTISLGHPQKTDGGEDPAHEVSIHLPTGTITVSCSATPVNPDEIAQQWDEAHFRAEMTGQLDELLAFAQQYVATAHQRRTDQVLERRMIDLLTDTRSNQSLEDM